MNATVDIEMENASIANVNSSSGEIEVASCTVEKLFSEEINETSIKGKLVVPEYQRPYVWKEKEVTKLITDLTEYGEYNNPDKPLYYLGSIILHKADGNLNIIDGQQRLTTLAIIQHISNKNKVPKIKYASPATIENIKINYKFISEKLNKNDLKIDLKKINITLVVTESEDDAYTFFETQNTGGVRLSGIDIIKAHHLREVTIKGKQQNNYALMWEQQRQIATVIEQLIKARRWGIINWEVVPSDKDLKGTKQSIIEDFSEKTLPANEKNGYQQVISNDNYSNIQFQPSPFSIRQPIANGENFIDYLKDFCELYQRLFNNQSDIEIDEDYYKFNKDVIKNVDGTVFLKEFYEIAMLCYANKFGIKNILEASYWIFRYSYSRRITSRSTVRERSIPAFIKENCLFDIILSCFNHQQVINHMKQFKYTINTENADGTKVKARYIKRVADYFNFFSKLQNNVENFDDLLIEAIKGQNNGK